MKFTKEVKTAILAIVAVVLLIFGYNFLKGKNLLDDSRIFYAIYDDVEGLAPSSEVTINGLKVGTVTSIDFLNRKGDLIVTFTVKNNFPFSKNSIARVYGGNIIGNKSLEIVPDYERGEVAVSGDTLKSETEEGLMELVNDRLAPLQQKIELVMMNTDSLLTSINEVLDKDTRDGLRSSVSEFHQTMINLRETSSNVEGLVSRNSSKLDRTFTNLDEMSGNLNRISDTLSQVDINRIVKDLENAVADFQQISDKINNGDGTVGKLLNDDDVYNNLDRATRQMEQLIQDIKLNPKRYLNFSVFGRNRSNYTPPEDPLK